jgi:hypothetical protein
MQTICKLMFRASMTALVFGAAGSANAAVIDVRVRGYVTSADFAGPGGFGVSHDSFGTLFPVGQDFGGPNFVIGFVELAYRFDFDRPNDPRYRNERLLRVSSFLDLANPDPFSVAPHATINFIGSPSSQSLSLVDNQYIGDDEGLPVYRDAFQLSMTKRKLADIVGPFNTFELQSDVDFNVQQRGLPLSAIMGADIHTPRTISGNSVVGNFDRSIGHFNYAAFANFSQNQTSDVSLTYFVDSVEISVGSILPPPPPAAPEPASWALMIAGFGLVGSAMRKRTMVRVSYA